MELIIAMVALAGLAGDLWIMRRQTSELAALRRDLEIEQEWCAYWQKRAMEGDDRIEALSENCEALRELYGDRTRQLLAKNSYLIGAYGYGKAKN